jgi:hypothetical protein
LIAPRFYCIMKLNHLAAHPTLAAEVH